LIYPLGSTIRISWTFDDDIYDILLRQWIFTSNNVSEEQLAGIFLDDGPYILNSSLPEVFIEKPFTLVLRNIDYHYNGTYKFILARASNLTESAEVVLFISGKSFTIGQPIQPPKLGI
jgi:hypothetical protein